MVLRGLEAIVTTTFEVAYRLTREGSQHGLAGLLANMVDLTLAPFMGSAEPNRFIDCKLEQGTSDI
jgi:hypothetical protein